MHSKELIEIAVALAGQAPEMLSPNSPTDANSFLAAFSQQALQTYQRKSIERFEIWDELFHAGDAKPFEFGSPAAWTIFSLIEEIFASEVLTRMWTALLFAAKQQGICKTEHALIANDIYLRHQSIKLRAMKWILIGPAAGAPLTNEMNLIRKRCERWTDLCLGRIQPTYNVASLGFDAERVNEYGTDFKEDTASGCFAQVWEAITGSIRAAIGSQFQHEAVCPAENRAIAESVLSALGSAGDGVFQSVPHMTPARAVRVADNVLHMVDELLNSEIADRTNL